MTNGDLSKWGTNSWKSLLDGQPDPMAFLDVGHKIIYANEALAALIGLERRELIGRPCFEVFHGRREPVYGCPHEQALTDHCGHSKELMIGTPGRKFHVSAKPVFDAHDKLLGVLHVSHDITRHAEREKDLQTVCDELERRLESRARDLSERLLIEKLATSLLLRSDRLPANTDVPALVHECVDEIAKVLGYDRCSFWEVPGDSARLMGCYEREANSFPALSPVMARARDPWLFVALDEDCACGHFATGGVNRCVAGVHALHAGEVGYLLLAECLADRTYCGASMRSEHIQLLCHLVANMVRRIRESVRTQVLLDRLLQADRIARLGQLSAVLVHEVSQPLSATLCNAQAAVRLLDRPDPDVPAALDALNDIVLNTRHAGDVMRRTRTMFKGEKEQRIAVSFAALTQDVLKLLEGTLAESGATVRVQIDPMLPEVLGDPIQLQQVMINLIKNAVDAVRGKPQRLITVSAARSAANRIELRVDDTGDGILSGQEEAIFSPFHTTKADGMGLGLPICREIVTRHDGAIRAERASQGGTAFVVTLPAPPDVQSA